MAIRRRNGETVVFLERQDDVLFHELICAIQLNGKLRIGAFERLYTNHKQASRDMRALIEQGIYHVGVIRTHYRDGNIGFTGAVLFGMAHQHGLGSHIAADMLAHIVGKTVVGIFAPDDEIEYDTAGNIVLKNI